jgi:hypothetical protein
LVEDVDLLQDAEIHIYYIVLVQLPLGKLQQILLADDSLVEFKQLAHLDRVFIEVGEF